MDAALIKVFITVGKEFRFSKLFCQDSALLKLFWHYITSWTNVATIKLSFIFQEIISKDINISIFWNKITVKSELCQAVTQSSWIFNALQINFSTVCYV